jgi:hypothetical protein
VKLPSRLRKWGKKSPAELEEDIHRPGSQKIRFIESL